MTQVFYHETCYTCPYCGISFKLTEFTEDEILLTEPHLICPVCGLRSFRTDNDERFIIQSYVRNRDVIKELIEARLLEAM